MFRTKDFFVFFILFVNLLLISKISTSETEIDDIEANEIEQLIAVDDEEEMRQNGEGGDATVFGSIIELNSNNVKTVMENNEFVFVLGYTPWCHGSANLMPHFTQAATILKRLGSSILMAKLDCDRYPKAASLLGIKGFPTLIFYVNGSRHLYTGGFYAGEMVTWGRKRTGFPIIRLGNLTEAEEFLKRHSNFVLGFFERFEGAYYKEFLKAALSDNDFQFVEVGDVAVAEFLFPNIKFNKFFIGLIKSEPERYSAYDGTYKVDNIIQFLNDNKLPLVYVLTELNSQRVRSSHLKLQVMVFSTAETFKILADPIQNIARKFKTKILFIHVDITNDDLAKPYLTIFGLEDSENTVVFAFDSEMSSKYLLESDPTPKNIEDFCFKITQHNISEYFKSQPLPNNELKLIKDVVGKTFDELLLANDKHILLEVHTSWCTNCESTHKQMDNVAKNFDGSPNIIFARIDGSKNEHPKLQVDSFPTLLFYIATDKSKPIKLPIDSSLDDMVLLIKQYVDGHKQVSYDEL